MTVEETKQIERNATEIGVRKLALALGQYMVTTQKIELSNIELMRITEAVIKTL